MVIARPINLNVSCELHPYSLQRTRSPAGGQQKNNSFCYIWNVFYFDDSIFCFCFLFVLLCFCLWFCLQQILVLSWKQYPQNSNCTATYLPIAGGRIIGFIPFLRVFVLCEMYSVSSRIWTRVAESISYDDNHYTTGTSYNVYTSYMVSTN